MTKSEMMDFLVKLRTLLDEHNVEMYGTWDDTVMIQCLRDNERWKIAELFEVSAPCINAHLIKEY